MKNLLYLLVLVALLVNACQQDDPVSPKKGQVQFSMSGLKDTGNGRAGNIADPAAVMISIRDAQGNTVKQNEKIELIPFGQGFVTHSLELATSDYVITEFLVLDEQGEVIYATPLENSPLASAVDDPLPVYFSVSETSSTLVTLQVLNVSATNSPEDFGYASFSFDIIELPQSEEIQIIFAVPTNAHYVTHGYDSVSVTFTNQQTSIRRNLAIISPVEARGTITAAELGLNSSNNSTWEVKVQGYYESIDEVEYNVHVNEAVTTTTLGLSTASTGIRIEHDSVTLSNDKEEYQSNPLTWENWAHLKDDTGYFYFVINNNPCHPTIKYSILKDDATGVYYDKYVYNEVDFYESRISTDAAYLKGDYTDSITFSQMCPPNVTGPLYADLYFMVYAQECYYSCYLVWYYENTPVDPERNLIDGTTNSTGIFKVVLGTPTRAGRGG